MSLNQNNPFLYNESEKEREDYRKVREYLGQNPNSNAIDIANATGIAISKISKYVKEGSFYSKKG